MQAAIMGKSSQLNKSKNQGDSRKTENLTYWSVVQLTISFSAIPSHHAGVPSCSLAASCLSPVFSLWTPKPFITSEQPLQVTHWQQGHGRQPKSSPRIGHDWWSQNLGKGKPELGLIDIWPSCLATSFWLGVIAQVLDRCRMKCFWCGWKYQDLTPPEEFPTPLVCQMDWPMPSLWLRLETDWVRARGRRPRGAGCLGDLQLDGLSLWDLEAIFPT